jgi:hypothetical protein
MLMCELFKKDVINKIIDYNNSILYVLTERDYDVTVGVFNSKENALIAMHHYLSKDDKGVINSQDYIVK